MRRAFLFLVAFAAAGVGGAPARAADQISAFPRPAWFRQHFPGSKARVELQAPRRLADFVAAGTLELTLRAYIELVLQNNTDIALAKLLVETPSNGIQRAFGDYDPKLAASFSSTSATQTSFNSLEGAATVKTSQQPVSGSYSQLLPSGTNLSVQFDAQRSTSNQAFNTYNPVLNSDLTVSFDQPLLRNRGAAMTKMSILVARSALQVSRYQLRDQVTAWIANAENIYWSVVESRENLALTKRLLESRAAALDRAQKQLDSGALLPLDIYQPKSDYASAQLSVIQAARFLAQQENALRQQIGADLDPSVRELPISLTEPLDIPMLTVPGKEATVALALKARADRLAAAAAFDADDIGIRRANEALKPSVSLVGGYRSQGLGGTYLPDAVPGGLGDALGQMLRFGFPVYQFGLRVSLPIRDHGGAADLADALVKKKQDALALRKLEQTIRRQALDAVDNLETARASLEQAQLARDYADKRFAAEQKKYELGITTLFLLLQSQTSFSLAENAVLEESINYRRNLINLYQTTGRLLDERGIVLD